VRVNGPIDNHSLFFQVLRISTWIDNVLQLKALKPKPNDYPKEINTLGDHIRKRRLDLGLRQTDVGRFIGVSKLMACHWETHCYQPSVRQIPKIIEFLGYMPYKTPRSFGQWLKQCRQSVGLTLKQLARALSIDESTITGWERGEHQPISSSLNIIKSFFGSILTRR
jgi:DNA-binding transcriptional regulator YiaG